MNTSYIAKGILLKSLIMLKKKLKVDLARLDLAEILDQHMYVRLANQQHYFASYIWQALYNAYKKLGASGVGST